MMWLWIVGALAQPYGWRIDGTGHRDAHPPRDLASVVWKTELPGGSNASPVVVQGKVCFAIEPASVGCADAATGELTWTATNHVWDALPKAQADPIREQVEQAEALEADLKSLKARYGQLRREVRKPGASDALAELEEVTAQMGALRTRIDAAAPYRTVDVDPDIGWTSASLLTDGTHLFVKVSNGVLSCFTPDGERVWSRWLGAPQRDLRGYLGLPTASPIWVDGTLVVGHNTLLGLDPATGKQRWSGGTYLDFGTPGAAQIDGLWVVLTPDGRALRASDGRELATGLADIWYTGPIVHDDVAYWVGTKAGSEEGFQGRATAVRLEREGDDLKVTPLWSVDLDTRDRFYATPVWWQGRLVTVTRGGELYEIDAKTGAIRQRTSIAPSRTDEVWASPLVLSDRLYVQVSGGSVLWFDQPGTWEPSAQARLERSLATPVFDGGNVWHRGRRHLIHIAGGAPAGE